MIKRVDISEIGHFNKPHGIKGEISATLDVDVDIADAKCIIVDVDGIFVPFFIDGVRPKTAETVLLTIAGVDSEIKAKEFASKKLYILTSDLPDTEEDDDDEEGLYASDLIGYRVIDAEHGPLGEITDINDATENVLFIISTPDGGELLIPVADEFIEEIDSDSRTLHTAVPAALLDINSL